MERRHGRAPWVEPCRIAVPHDHYKITTVTAPMRASGPFTIHLMDGATNGARFLSYVTDMLVPALTPGDTVVMDNLAAHEVARVRQDIEAAGAQLRYLPAYRPDLNPIEQIFAKIKALLCTAAARTVKDRWPPSATPSPASNPTSAATPSPRWATMSISMMNRSRLQTDTPDPETIRKAVSCLPLTVIGRGRPDLHRSAGVRIEALRLRSSWPTRSARPERCLGRRNTDPRTASLLASRRKAGSCGGPSTRSSRCR